MSKIEPQRVLFFAKNIVSRPLLLTYKILEMSERYYSSHFMIEHNIAVFFF